MQVGKLRPRGQDLPCVPPWAQAGRLDGLQPRPNIPAGPDRTSGPRQRKGLGGPSAWPTLTHTGQKASCRGRRREGCSLTLLSSAPPPPGSTSRATQMSQTAPGQQQLPIGQPWGVGWGRAGRAQASPSVKAELDWRLPTSVETKGCSVPPPPSASCGVPHPP